LAKKPELGGACISVRSESQYLEFSMSTSVQGWRTKCFYIKDQKSSSSDKYGIALFDASQELKKLASWDSPPTEAEMEEIKPLLARIQELKSSKEVRCRVHNSWHFSCNIEFSPCSIVSPSYGLFLAWKILLEYLKI
jgi:hypothetical protein